MASDYDYLLSLQAVRDQAAKVYDAAKDGRLKHFDFNPARMQHVADYVSGLIDRDFGPDRYDSIPPHGRWQHFDVGSVERVGALIKRWQSEAVNEMEVTRRLIDLFFVSVLLDAGAGDVWRFEEPGTGQVIMRSEGIAVASLYMFTDGCFSSDALQKETVDGRGLVSLKEDAFAKGFQVSENNSMLGVSSRVQLLQAVGSSLLSLPEIFGQSGRPGNLVDYLVSLSSDRKTIDYERLWTCLQKLLIPSWPSNRTVFDGKPIGDAWPLDVLAESQSDQSPRDKIHPFHKLTQWLAYSLSVPFQRILGYEWDNIDLGTGLPEYRNGGLFVDLEVLTLKEEDEKAGTKSPGQLPEFDAASDTVVEWRAMTVVLLDELHRALSEQYKSRGITLTLPQMLEAGTWKAGRELAAQLRPETKSSPIVVISDGTLY
ncbi:hypothetical protein F66182_965 [Fusarium sp. NRRL 66182]|nr:hypothetical protein F66182_965 [Fusarium sp. NRRL 66182]